MVFPWARVTGRAVRAVRSVIEAARDAGIGQLTLYSFSSENWSRPTEEVEGLMRLHAEMIDAEVPTLHKNDCRVVFVGSREELSRELLEKMEWAESLTAEQRPHDPLHRLQLWRTPRDRATRCARPWPKGSIPADSD